jgi:drug/metabolite transporter (DMT)-like permease
VQKPVLARVAPLQVTWIGSTIATLALLPFAPALVHEAASAPAGALAWTLYLGAVPTALGFAGYAYALPRTSAGRMAALAYLIPVVAVLLGWAVLGEAPSAAVAAGGGLCLAGVALARTGTLTSRARRSRPGGARPRA